MSTFKAEHTPEPWSADNHGAIGHIDADGRGHFIAFGFKPPDARRTVVCVKILREVVRRMRQGDDWAEVVAGRVKWRPRWLLSFSDPAVGHDGGLYRGAGATYLGTTVGGKEVWGWPLTQEPMKKLSLFE